MNAADVAVLAGGMAAIAWVNWYFFFARRSASAATMVGAVLPRSTGTGGAGTTGEEDASGFARQNVTVVVRGGYEPSTIHARSGVPVRITFDRQENSSCSEEVVFPDFGVKRFLPAFKKTVVEITPPKPGTYEFTCGMSMLRGKLIAQAAEKKAL